MAGFSVNPLKSDIESLYTGIEPDICFIQLKNYCKITTLGLQKYLLQNEENLIQIATKQEQPKTSFKKLTNTKMKSYNLTTTKKK